MDVVVGLRKPQTKELTDHRMFNLKDVDEELKKAREYVSEDQQYHIYLLVEGHNLELEDILEYTDTNYFTQNYVAGNTYTGYQIYEPAGLVSSRPDNLLVDHEFTTVVSAISFLKMFGE